MFALYSHGMHGASEGKAIILDFVGMCMYLQSPGI